MCKYILLGLGGVLVLIMVVAAMVVQEYGWQGFLILLAGCAILLWVFRKSAPAIIRYLLMRPLRRIAIALRGARIEVYSIVPIPAPEVDRFQPLHERIPIGDDRARGGGSAGSSDWYRLDFMVIPRETEASRPESPQDEGWFPALVGVDLSESSRFPWGRPPIRSIPTGATTSLLESSGAIDVWDGREFAPADGIMFSEQRLRLDFAVSRDVNEVLVRYASLETIGRISIPRVRISADLDS